MTGAEGERAIRGVVVVVAVLLGSGVPISSPKSVSSRLPSRVTGVPSGAARGCCCDLLGVTVPD